MSTSWFSRISPAGKIVGFRSVKDDPLKSRRHGNETRKPAPYGGVSLVAVVAMDENGNSVPSAAAHETRGSHMMKFGRFTVSWQVPFFRDAVLPFVALFTMALPWGPHDCAAQSESPQTPSDWDLYMLRLVNRARTDPRGEDAIQGTNFAESAVPPLAYSALLGRAAQNHNEWMGANRNNPAIEDPNNPGPAPHSFSHFETLNAQPGGPSGSELTEAWSGDDVGQRITFVEFSWGRAGENIAWRSDTPLINTELIDFTHGGWWNSDGHRANMMQPEYTVFGHHARNDLDGEDPNSWATQNFGRPLFPPFYNIFGLLYEDRDSSGGWTPRDADDPLREGLGGVTFDVLSRGNGASVTSGQTFDNGAYTINIPDGTYDVVFRDAALPGAMITLSSITVAGMNVDAGATLVIAPPSAPLQAGDANQDYQFDQRDIVMVLGAGKYLTGQPATWGEGDWNTAPGGRQGRPPVGDGLFSQRDIVAAQQSGLYLTGPYAVLSSNGRVDDVSRLVLESAIDSGVQPDAFMAPHEPSPLSSEPALLGPGRGVSGIGTANPISTVSGVLEPRTLFLMALGAAGMAIATRLRN